MFHDHTAPRPLRWAASAALVAALALGGTAEGKAAELSVEIAGIRSGQGSVFVAVHGSGSAETFPDEAGAVYRVELPAASGSARFALLDVASGRYAIAAFHDENGNGELDTNMLGMPTEGFGISNDPDATFGPPGFEESAFDLGSEPSTVRITFSY